MRARLRRGVLRHHIRALAALVVVACVAAVVVPDVASPDSDRQRAQASYAAMQRNFYERSLSLYAEAFPALPDERYAQLWPFSQALGATVRLAQLQPGRTSRAAVYARLRTLERYWDGSQNPGGYATRPFPRAGLASQYYDDNAWVGLELVQVSRLYDDPKMLRRAAQLFTLISRGWDPDKSKLCPGGVFWARSTAIRDRNTVSTARASQLGAQLYLATGNRHFLRWATAMYRWVKSCLAAPNGLFWDHIDIDGHVDQTQWSYNQGAMVSAGVALYAATRNARYLSDAEDVAEAAVANFDPIYGSGEPPYFIAIFFHDLWSLAELEPSLRFETAIRVYADEVWTNDRDATTGLFHFQAAGRTQLLEQAAMVQIYADLAMHSAPR
jgi:hypothetical protein